MFVVFVMVSFVFMLRPWFSLRGCSLFEGMVVKPGHDACVELVATSSNVSLSVCVFMCVCACLCLSVCLGGLGSVYERSPTTYSLATTYMYRTSNMESTIITYYLV